MPDQGTAASRTETDETGAAPQPRLNDNERAILGELRARHGAPVSAYDIRDALRDQGVKYPMTVYRALDKLMASGLVHRIESSNGFVACSTDCRAGQPAFAICSACGAVSEFVATAVMSVVTDAVGAFKFEPSSVTMEVRGVCHACATTEASTRT